MLRDPICMPSERSKSAADDFFVADAIPPRESEGGDLSVNRRWHIYRREGREK